MTVDEGNTNIIAYNLIDQLRRRWPLSDLLLVILLFGEYIGDVPLSAEVELLGGGFCQMEQIE